MKKGGETTSGRRRGAFIDCGFANAFNQLGWNNRVFLSAINELVSEFRNACFTERRLYAQELLRRLVK